MTNLPTSITIRWHIDDVRDVRPDLNPSQACKVLAAAERAHDACLGINWDVLKCIADDLFPITLTAEGKST